MRDNTSSAHHRTVSAVVWVVGALWIVAGIGTAIALGGGLTRLAVVLAIVITEWWLVSQLEDRFEGGAAARKAKMAPATQLRPATLADASWPGPRAA
jgi:ABC-type nickel/cobalt efflux system permease component RcnA